MTDELDCLTDLQLSQTFASEIAGVSCVHTWQPKHGRRTLRCAYLCTRCGKVTRSAADTVQVASVATHVDVLTPWLDKANGWQGEYDQGETPPHVVEVWTPRYGKGEAMTFARAACIALIRAKRAVSG